MGRSKLYTRTGDDGTTGLIGGTRVSKADARIEAYGTVDELNAALGLVLALGAGEHPRLADQIRQIQEDLFCIGALLATPEGEPPGCAITDAHVGRLESWIDEADAALPPMRAFILPGGSAVAAALHLSRTVCRRAERRVVQLAEQVPISLEIVRYLNRLGDLLFALARWVNHVEGHQELEWRPREQAR